jgi:hypothetical protein
MPGLRRVSFWTVFSAWALLSCVLICATLVSRVFYLDRLARRIILEARPSAETGCDFASQGPNGKVSALEAYLCDWQGPAVYILEHKRHHPELERVLLLLETRRSYNGIYFYPNCFNWDLRLKLIAHCDKHFPDDPLVAWATARTLTTCGDYAAAIKYWERAFALKLDPVKAGDTVADVTGRYVACLCLQGRAADAERFLAQRAAAAPGEAAARYAWLDFLSDESKYQQLLPLCQQAAKDFPGDTRFMVISLRTRFWMRDRKVIASGYTPSSKPERREAELYAIDGSAKHLKALSALPTKLQNELDQLEALNAAGFDSKRWDRTEEVRKRLNETAGQVLRAHTLRHEWRAIDDYLQQNPPPEYADESASLQAARLLSAIALGKPVNAIRLDTLAPAGGLVPLLVSDHFRQAIKDGGRDQATILASIRMALQPTRDTYFDYSNGSLQWN